MSGEPPTRAAQTAHDHHTLPDLISTSPGQATTASRGRAAAVTRDSIHDSDDDESAILDWGHGERRASVAGPALSSSAGAISHHADECGINQTWDADERLELLMSTEALPDLRDEVMVYFGMRTEDTVDTLTEDTVDMLTEDTANKPAELQNPGVAAPVVASSPRPNSPPQNSNAHRSLSELLANPTLSHAVVRSLGKRILPILEKMERHPDLSVDSLCIMCAVKTPFTPQEIKLKRRAALKFLDRFRGDVHARPACQGPPRDTSGYRAFWDRWEGILAGPDQEPLMILRQRPEFGEYWVEKFRLLHAQPERPLATMSRAIFRPADPFLRLSDDQRCELIERMQAQALEVALEVLGSADQILVIMRAAESALRAKAAAAAAEAAAGSNEERSEAPPRRKYQRLAPAPTPRTGKNPRDPLFTSSA